MFEYRTDSWTRSATVIAKVEVTSGGTNQRFVVTNQWVGSALHTEQRYNDYVQRGTSEQRNDELKIVWNGSSELPSLHGQLLASRVSHACRQPAERDSRQRTCSSRTAKRSAGQMTNSADQSPRASQSEHSANRAGSVILLASLGLVHVCQQTNAATIQILLTDS